MKFDPNDTRATAAKYTLKAMNTAFDLRDRRLTLSDHEVNRLVHAERFLADLAGGCWERYRRKLNQTQKSYLSIPEISPWVRLLLAIHSIRLLRSLAAAVIDQHNRREFGAIRLINERWGGWATLEPRVETVGEPTVEELVPTTVLLQQEA